MNGETRESTADQALVSAISPLSTRSTSRFRFDQRILLLALAAGFPAALVALILLWTGNYTPKVQWTLTVFIVGVWTGCSFSVRHRVVLPLQTLSNLLAALQALLDHPWPGNIRELDHAVERGVLMAQGSTIRLGELGLRIDRDSSSRMEDMSLEEVEGFLIKKAMARFDGNVSQAAKALGLSRSALYRRLQRYGL